MSIRNEIRVLFRLAAPIAAAQAGTVLMGAVDAAIVGRLGARELAAVGLGNSLFFTLSIVGVGVTMAFDPLTSQAVGAGDRARARTLLWQGVWLALIVSALLAAVMAAIAPLIRLMEIEPVVADQALLYLNLRLLSLAPMLVFIVIRSYLQALHLTRPMVIAMVVGNVFNFLADWLFVFGGASLPEWTGPLRAVPAMKITGAAIATVLGSFLQLAIVIPAVRSVEKPHGYSRRANAREMLLATKIGLPVGLQMCVEYSIFALVGLLAGRLGAAHLAAHQVAITLVSFTFTVAVGVGAAGSVRVGHAVGRRDLPGTRLAGFAALLGGSAVMSFSAVAMFLFPDFFAQLITDQRDVLRIAVPLLLVAAVFQLADGIQAVGGGVLRGAGDTSYIFFAHLFGHWFVGLPAAVYFGFVRGGGVEGLWWGLCAGLFAVALALLMRFLKISTREIEPL